jgi:hypothetical protein
MKRTLLLAAVLLAALPATAPAITTNGTFDGNAHPNVGALFADWDPEVPGPDFLCSGTLISPTVFLTASHCTDFLPEVGVDPDEVFVSFDPDAATDDGAFIPEAQRLDGTYHTHPRYGPHFGDGDRHDIAVVVLDEPYSGATPAELPPANFLERTKKSLFDQRFTAVGYGDVREIKQKGPNSFFFDGARRFVGQSFNQITKVWLKLEMNPLKGSGGTCFGDSGGPHFWGAGDDETNRVVALTVSGDAACRSTDVDYKLDTASARAFLDDFVTLP